jgi:hypothetical protein
MRRRRLPSVTIAAIAMGAVWSCGGDTTHSQPGDAAVTGSGGGAGMNQTADASAGGDSPYASDATADGAPPDAWVDGSSVGGSSGGSGVADAGVACGCDGGSYGPGEEGLKCFCERFDCSLQLDDPLSSWSCDKGDIVVSRGTDCGRVTLWSCWGEISTFAGFTYDLVSGKLVYAVYLPDFELSECGGTTTAWAGTLDLLDCPNAAPACSLCADNSLCFENVPPCDSDSGAGGSAGAAGAGTG